MTQLVYRSGPDWEFAPGSDIASRTAPAATQELATCAPCHSRRSLLRAGEPAGRPLLDAYRLALLDEGLYHADGQIDGEVYVYGSFLQSRMQRRGVRCSDCHEPHSLDLRAPRNALCGQSHKASRVDTPTHHFHPVGPLFAP